MPHRSWTKSPTARTALAILWTSALKSSSGTDHAICRTAQTEIYIHDGRLGTGTNNGLTLFGLGAMMAHHVHQGRRDRILRGQAAARGANVKFGRPPIASAKAEKVRMILATGKGVPKRRDWSEYHPHR